MGIASVTCAAPRALLLASVLLCAIATSTQQRIDCRRFVFAPICRGVAAKRSEGGGAAMRLLHSVHPLQRTMFDSAETLEAFDPYVTLSPEQTEIEQPDIETNMEAENRDLLHHRVLRDRKQVALEGPRPEAPYRLYLPRLPHTAPLSDIEY